MSIRKRRMLEVYYDSWCPLCTGIRSRLERWDWLHVLRFYSIRDQHVTEWIPVSMDNLMDSMHARESSSGRILSGIEAVHALSMRVPILMPISPFIWLSMKLGIGGKLYRYIASRRTIVPAGQCNSNGCELPVRRNSQGDDSDTHSSRT